MSSRSRLSWKVYISAALCIAAMQACAAQPDTKVNADETQPDQTNPTTIAQPDQTGPTTISPPDPTPASGSSGTAQGGTSESSTGTIEPTGVSTAESGVVYPEKPGRYKPVKDAFPPAERTKAETERLAEMQFGVDPREQIEKYVRGLKIPKDFPILARAHVFFLDSPALKKIFPASIVYVLRFPQWPVAIAPPAPLGNNNLFIISKEAKDATEVKGARDAKDIVLVTDIKEDSLKQFLLKCVSVHSESSAETAVEASLALAQELAQDGMFKFAIDQSSVSATKTESGLKASGQVSVAPVGGNSGSVRIDLQFDNKGTLTDYKQTVNLMAGMRPICQSTKLLDPDPIVRKMAEQDLLIMGSSAKEYLDWQRTQVSPELRAAIDRIWARIVKEGR